MRASHERMQVVSAENILHPPIIKAYPEPTVLLPAVSAGSRRWSRALDLAAALPMLLVHALPMGAIALLIKSTSKGPVIFRQKRVGQHGALVEVLKFRTMRHGTDDEVAQNPDLRALYEQNDFKLPSDHPNITRVGRLLRRSSLDELPQLWNVLRGEMSMVGVRPLLPDELGRRSAYDRQLYLLHRPGLTGLWQVEGRCAIGDNRRIELDRRYLATWSVRANLKILLRTPWAVLRKSGAH